VRREFDLVAARSVDRVGRSLQDLVAFLGEVQTSGMDLYLRHQGLDNSTPAGKALFQMMGVFAEFERAMIVERTLAGLARAKAQGRRLGRQKVSSDIEVAVAAALQAGTGILKTAREVVWGRYGSTDQTGPCRGRSQRHRAFMLGGYRKGVLCWPCSRTPDGHEHSCQSPGWSHPPARAHPARYHFGTRLIFLCSALVP
jgi:hypothetical protein